MTSAALKSFIVDMHRRMRHIYQPKMIVTLLASGWASDDDIVSAFLEEPECSGKSRIQLLKVLNRVDKRRPTAPGQVLTAHGAVERRNGGHALIGFDQLSEEQKAEIRELCRQALEEYRQGVPSFAA